MKRNKDPRFLLLVKLFKQASIARWVAVQFWQFFRCYPIKLIVENGDCLRVTWVGNHPYNRPQDGRDVYIQSTGRRAERDSHKRQSLLFMGELDYFRCMSPEGFETDSSDMLNRQTDDEPFGKNQPQKLALFVLDRLKAEWLADPMRDRGLHDANGFKYLPL